MAESKKTPGKKVGSLQRQIAVLFIGFLLFSLVAITLINALFLERYYISRKTDVLLEAITALKELENVYAARAAAGEAAEPIEDIPEELRKESTQNNLSWIILTKDNQTIAQIGSSENRLRDRLFGYAYDLDFNKSRANILKSTDTYVIQQVSDRFVGMDYVESWGNFPDGNFFLIRTPLESIKESAKISNSFYFVVGLTVIFVGVFLIWIEAKRVTKPISELTELSKRMSNLDFDVRYQSQAGNEIDTLGENFNRMSAQLEQTISELKSANLELQRDIADKIKVDQMRKEFLDNVSHELKTPIALIQGYAEGLKENISEDLESREFYCDVIMDESAKMNKLVKNLLTLNQLESGNDTAVMERFDIVSLIRGVLQSLDIMIQQKSAKVIFEEDAPVHVWADEFKTEEVLTNYISNALNHLEGEHQIEIRLWMAPEKIKISVFNTGRPIPEADLPNLWNKFYKVDKARTREYGGSGIGLSIVKAIMEGMNQEYGVKNYDNGVEFWFTLDRK